ncbi:MAG: hypothetical protein WAN36_04010, partial [Calditrichia bacterium]
MAMRQSYFRKKGDSYILLTSMGLVVSLAMVILIVGIILVKALGFFWPGDLVEFKLQNGEQYLGEVWADGEQTTDDPDEVIRQVQLKIGNRDVFGRDFIWLNRSSIEEKSNPPFATTFERWEYGNFYGFIRSLSIEDETFNGSPEEIYRKAQEAHELAQENRRTINNLEEELNELVRPLSEIQRELSLYEISEKAETAQGKKELDALRKSAAQLEQEIGPEYEKISGRLSRLHEANGKMRLQVETADGQDREMVLADIVRFFQPNRMNAFQKSLHYT